MNAPPGFHTLFSKWMDDELTVEEFIELQAILEQDPIARELFADHLVLDSMLSDELGQESLTALVDLIGEATSTQPLEAMDTQRPSVIPPNANLSQRYWLRTMGGMIAAASVAALLFGWVFRAEQTVFAGADRIVKAAMVTHSEPIERVYVVQLERGVDPLQRTDLPRDVQVSTQGDRFWVSMNGKRKWAWGRSPEGAVWITLGPDRAVIVGREEIGRPLQYIGDLYTLNLETMLKGFLKYCRLERTETPLGADIITATPRPLWSGRPLKRATIEVDRESKAIRKLTLERQFVDQEPCVITFTLVESRLADDAAYGPHGHLTEPHRIYTQSSDIRDRHQMVLSWFGPVAERWMNATGKAIQ